ncbi:FAD-dependent monooxygenase [Spirillospora sp. CA-253888]
MDTIETRVLVVGGSLVGLSTAVFLAHHGVRCTLVERHPGTSIHPRAVGYYPRTVELLRQVGLEDAARKEAAGYETHRTRAVVRSLAAEPLSSREELDGDAGLGDLTPARLLMLTQDRLEPLLRARAEELGADLRFGTELLAFAQDEEAVTAVVRDGDGARLVRADHLVGCDGPRSLVRQTLAVPCRGRGTISRHLSIAFRADLRKVLGERRYSVVHVKNPDVTGIMVHDDTLTGGVLIVAYDPAEGDGPDGFTDERCARLVRAAVGADDVPVTIRSRWPWDMAEQVAARFAAGRVLLAGDAAHVIPPTGAYGANTGIADAHNLAWKLALVLSGAAGEGLLATYAEERHPVGGFAARQGALTLAGRSGAATDEQREETVDALTVTMGLPYRSAAVVPDAGADRLPQACDPRRLRGEPGTRAPHIWLEHAGEPVCTLDLFGRDFVLLAGEQGSAWTRAARDAAALAGVALTARRIVARPAEETGETGEALVDPSGSWLEAYGLEPQGAVLVRPDGVVAWRSTGADPAGDATATLTGVFGTVLARPGEGDRHQQTETPRQEKGGPHDS